MIDPRTIGLMRDHFLREREPLAQMKARILAFDRPSYRAHPNGALEVIDHGRTPEAAKSIAEIDQMLDELRATYTEYARASDGYRMQTRPPRAVMLSVR
mgnify:CR=1 FL=1